MELATLKNMDCDGLKLSCTVIHNTVAISAIALLQRVGDVFSQRPLVPSTEETS